MKFECPCCEFFSHNISPEICWLIIIIQKIIVSKQTISLRVNWNSSSKSGLRSNWISLFSNSLSASTESIGSGQNVESTWKNLSLVQNHYAFKFFYRFLIWTLMLLWRLQLVHEDFKILRQLVQWNFQRWKLCWHFLFELQDFKFHWVNFLTKNLKNDQNKLC